MDARRFPEYFTRVYHAAKNLDHGALMNLHRHQPSLKVPVDVKDSSGLFTPAAALTINGKYKAVALLQQFGASSDFIAMAHAYKGEVKEAEALRKTKGINLKYLAIGAAMARDSAYAESLRTRFNLPLSWFVFGAAYARQHLYADKLIASADEQKQDEDDEEYISVELSRFRGMLLSDQQPECFQLYASHHNPAVKDSMTSLLQSRAATVKTSASVALFENPDLRLRDTQTHACMNDIVEWMIGNEYFHCPRALIYELAFITNDAFLTQLADAVTITIQKELSGFFFPAEMLGDLHYYHTLLKDFHAHCKTAAKLRTLMDKYQFNYDQADVFLSFKDVREMLNITVFTGSKIALAVHVIHTQTALSNQDALDMIEKYMLFHARNYVVKQLEDLYAKHYSAWNALAYSTQKLDRVHSLSNAAKTTKSFNELIDLPLEQFGLFSGIFKPASNPQLPKHKQPLSNNDTACELTQVVENLLTCARLNRANLPRK